MENDKVKWANRDFGIFVLTEQYNIDAEGIIPVLRDMDYVLRSANLDKRNIEIWCMR
jgi:hypothetical protein